MVGSRYSKFCNLPATFLSMSLKCSITSGIPDRGVTLDIAPMSRESKSGFALLDLPMQCILSLGYNLILPKMRLRSLVGSVPYNTPVFITGTLHTGQARVARFRSRRIGSIYLIETFFFSAASSIRPLGWRLQMHFVTDSRLPRDNLALRESLSLALKPIVTVLYIHGYIVWLLSMCVCK